MCDAMSERIDGNTTPDESCIRITGVHASGMCGVDTIDVCPVDHEENEPKKQRPVGVGCSLNSTLLQVIWHCIPHLGIIEHIRPGGFEYLCSWLEYNGFFLAEDVHVYKCELRDTVQAHCELESEHTQNGIKESDQIFVNSGQKQGPNRKNNTFIFLLPQNVHNRSCSIALCTPFPCCGCCPVSSHTYAVHSATGHSSFPFPFPLPPHSA